MSAKTVRTAVSLGLLAGLWWGCGNLIPPELKYVVHMKALLPEGRGDFTIDLEDSAQVFSKEGLVVRMRPMTDEELNRRFPPLFDGRHVNPYTHDKKDPQKGYVPPRFALFEVTVVNNTYAKVEFDPANAVMTADTGEAFRYYDPGREGAVPEGCNSFTKYYKTELGISGFEKELALERMGVVYKSIYHRNRPVFRGEQRTGMLVFDPLASDSKEVLLRVNRFVLSFDASGNPESTVDIDFRFKVDQGAVKAGGPKPRS